MPESFFTNLTVRRCRLPFRFAFAHNLAARNAADTLLLEVRARDGGTGHGQALPREYLTGETLESAAEDITQKWWPALQKLNIPATADFPELIESLGPLFAEADARRKNASYAALECAVADAVLQPRSFPAPPIPLTAVIGMTTPLKAFVHAGLLRALGYRHFKVKVGPDEKSDDARLAAVRRALGKKSTLAVDANAAWTPEEALRRMRNLKKFGVSLVEEPLTGRAGEYFNYRQLEQDSGIPTMADESLCTLADARRLLDAGSPSWWNLRFAKNGGFSGLSTLAAIARDAKISVYCGALVGETGILAAADRLGMFLTHAERGEYAFPRVLLKNDPFRGSPPGYRGFFSPEQYKRCTIIEKFLP